MTTRARIQRHDSIQVKLHMADRPQAASYALAQKLVSQHDDRNGPRAYNTKWGKKGEKEWKTQ